MCLPCPFSSLHINKLGNTAGERSCTLWIKLYRLLTDCSKKHFRRNKERSWWWKNLWYCSPFKGQYYSLISSTADSLLWTCMFFCAAICSQGGQQISSFLACNEYNASASSWFFHFIEDLQQITHTWKIVNSP